MFHKKLIGLKVELELGHNLKDKVDRESSTYRKWNRTWKASLIHN